MACCYRRLSPLILGLACVLFSTLVSAKELHQLKQRYSALYSAGFVTTTTTGQVQHQQQANQAYVPASTIKIMTAWLALQHWGEQYRFQTPFYWQANTQTLWVKGSGDPYLTSDELRLVANGLHQAGVGKIKTIALDNSAFAAEVLLPGTGRSDNPYDAVPSALAANFNTINFRKRKGKIQSAETETPLTAFARQHAKRSRHRKERINTGRDPRHAERYFAELLSTLLAERGIEHAGAIRWSKVPANAQLIYQHQNSRPLQDMLRPMLKYSNNFIANQLILSLASEHHGRPADEQAVQQYLHAQVHKHFDWQGFHLEDGAGLSHRNRLSPTQLLQLLQKFARWQHLMPKVQAGLHAKSGTLTGVSTLAGYHVRANQWRPFVLMLDQSMRHQRRNAIAAALGKL